MEAGKPQAGLCALIDSWKNEKRTIFKPCLALLLQLFSHSSSQAVWMSSPWGQLILLGSAEQVLSNSLYYHRGTIQHLSTGLVVSSRHILFQPSLAINSPLTSPPSPLRALLVSRTSSVPFFPPASLCNFRKVIPSSFSHRVITVLGEEQKGSRGEKNPTFYSGNMIPQHHSVPQSESKRQMVWSRDLHNCPISH